MNREVDPNVRTEDLWRARQSSSLSFGSDGNKVSKHVVRKLGQAQGSCTKNVRNP